MGIKKNFLFLCVIGLTAELSAKECRYTATVWNAKRGTVVDHITVVKDYSKLSQKEKGPYGCTPCESDQVDLNLPFHPSIRLCRHIASKIERVLIQAHEEGYLIKKIIAYRPGLSKGPLDQHGNRTELSNHSFGTAIDINPEHNGLYGNCKVWNTNCVLLKDGMRVLEHPLTLKKNSPLVLMMREIGMKWGGEIKGNQKDFMHFSHNGY